MTAVSALIQAWLAAAQAQLEEETEAELQVFGPPAAIPVVVPTVEE